MLIWIVFNIYWVSMCNLFQIEIFNLLTIFLMKYMNPEQYWWFVTWHQVSLCRISSQTLTRATNYKNACNVSNVVMFNWWQVTGKISLSFHGPACGAPEGIYSWIYLHDLKKKKFRSLTVALADKLFPFHWENIACNITSSVFLNMYLII